MCSTKTQRCDDHSLLIAELKYRDVVWRWVPIHLDPLLPHLRRGITVAVLNEISKTFRGLILGRGYDGSNTKCDTHVYELKRPPSREQTGLPLRTTTWALPRGACPLLPLIVVIVMPLL